MFLVIFEANTQSGLFQELNKHTSESSSDKQKMGKALEEMQVIKKKYKVLKLISFDWGLEPLNQGFSAASNVFHIQVNTSLKTYASQELNRKLFLTYLCIYLAWLELRLPQQVL